MTEMRLERFCVEQDMRCTITLPGRIRETAFSERFKKSVRLFLSFLFLSSPAVCLSRLLDAYPTPAVFSLS